MSEQQQTRTSQLSRNAILKRRLRRTLAKRIAQDAGYIHRMMLNPSEFEAFYDRPFILHRLKSIIIDAATLEQFAGE